MGFGDACLAKGLGAAGPLFVFSFSLRGACRVSPLVRLPTVLLEVTINKQLLGALASLYKQEATRGSWHRY